MPIFEDVRLADGSDAQLFFPSVPTPVTEATAPTVYVFRPGGVASANVFTTWVTLMGAVVARQAAGFAGPLTIEIDDSVVSPAVIPAGAYNFGADWSTTIRGRGIASTATAVAALQVAAGVTLIGVSEFKNLAIDSRSTAAVVDVAANEVFIRLYSVALTQNAAGPFFRASGTGALALEIREASSFSNAGGPCAQTPAVATATLFCNAFDNVFVDNNTLSKGAGSTLIANRADPGAFIQPTQIGAPTQVIAADATGVTQAAASIANPQGATVQAALLNIRGYRAVLVNGVVTIADAAITANSRIVPAGPTTAVGTALTVNYSALDADRVNGVSFKVTALLAGGTINAADQSTINVIVIN